MVDDLGRHGLLLADACALAADALEANGYPEAAVEYRQRALPAAGAATPAPQTGNDDISSGEGSAGPGGVRS